MSEPRVGVDIVDVDVVRRRFEAESGLLSEVFTGDELAYCHAQREPWPHLAARFAAKEALIKALGTGLAGSMTWKDIEVVRDATGAPGLRLHDGTQARFGAGGFGRCAVSLSHTDTYAVAVVMLSPA